ncbi:N-acetylmuramoyl-L-alanine amidase [Algivirga pacifica]|uniref:N-acetylmuramoyl-L-alanine amidase n=1 Tax=Algivirga pacifica TaxID=1162670 RepID=A0ABP9DBC3_9BACT
MKKLYTTFLMVLCTGILALAQVPADIPQLLEGKKIAIDPGHGGEDSDDRRIDLGNGYIYWEAAGTWKVGNLTNDLLQALGATTKMTRDTNDPNSPDRDPGLSERVAVANAFGADYMHSIHTNAANAKANYTLLLYRGEGDYVAYNEAKYMGGILAKKFHETWFTTDYYNRADKDFLPYHLGVLGGTNMPATLSEGAFHDVPAEGRRMMNDGYSKAAAWAIAKSFMEYFDVGTLPYGEVGGIIRNQNNDPINGVTVTLNAGLADEKVVQTDDIDNGIFFFDWLTPGEYTLTFEKEGVTTITETVTVTEGNYSREIYKTFDENAPINPPSAPTVHYVISPTGGSSLEVKWAAVQHPSLLGYRVYYATDDELSDWKLAADEQTIDATQTSVSIVDESEFKEVPADGAYHFKVVAVVDAGKGETLEGASADIYSRSSGAASEEKVLIVDGFNRQASYQESTHSFATQYFNAIRDSKDANVSTTHNSLVEKGQIDLNDYTTVFWFLGDESTADQTFSTSEQAKVKAFLQAGGNLLVSGSEVGWDLFEKGTESDQEFYTNYLKANFVDDGSIDYTPAKGVDETIFGGLTVEFGKTYTEDYPDAISSNGGANILQYASPGKFAGVAYSGIFDSNKDTASVVYIAFPLETAVQAEHTALTDVIMDYFQTKQEVIVSAIEEKLIALQSLKVYPNPVSDYASVAFTLKEGAEVTLSVYDLKGQRVQQKVQRLSTGEHTIALSTTDLRKGVYVLQLKVGEQEAMQTRFIK